MPSELQQLTLAHKHRCLHIYITHLPVKLLRRKTREECVKFNNNKKREKWWSHHFITSTASKAPGSNALAR